MDNLNLEWAGFVAGYEAQTGAPPMKFMIVGYFIQNGRLAAPAWGIPNLPVDLNWKDHRVGAYLLTPPGTPNEQAQPPKYFPSAPTHHQAMMDPTVDASDVEMWHTHAGLCVLRSNGEITEVFQQLTYNECQEKESDPIVLAVDPVTGVAEFGNPWVNIWMLHMWFYDLNPLGIFNGVHPNLDSCGPNPDPNHGRTVPAFFNMHHNQVACPED